MPGKATEVHLTLPLRAILQQIVRQTTAARRLAQRAQVIRLVHERLSNPDIAAEVHLDPGQVGKWRIRWQESMPALLAIAQKGKTASERRRAVEDVLSDAPRPGAPAKFTPQQVVSIIAIACEAPVCPTVPSHTGQERNSPMKLKKEDRRFHLNDADQPLPERRKAAATSQSLLVDDY
jgi:hypothetical protein